MELDTNCCSIGDIPMDADVEIPGARVTAQRVKLCGSLRRQMWLLNVFWFCSLFYTNLLGFN